MPNAHYISRAKSGLGIPENIVTLCQKCHHDFDNTIKREELRGYIRAYLDIHYPDFSDARRIYNK
jgi:5-methylcytosine-specific restriction endonuclease McrA